MGCSILDEGPLTPNHLLLRRPHICLTPLVNSNQRFSTKDFKLTQTLLDHYCGRLLKEYVCSWAQQENEVAKIKWWAWWRWHCVGAQDLRPRDIRPLGRIVKAHRGSDGIARSFDIQTSTGMVQRPAVTLSRVFPQLSSAPEGHWNKFIETHTHTHKKTKYQKEKFVLYFLFTFSFQMLLFVAGSVKEPSSFLFYLPHTLIFLPHLHFRPPKLIHFLISFSPNYFYWSYLFKLILLKKSEVVDIHFQYYL